MTSKMIIRNGTVIDTEPEPTALGRMDVLIVDGRIAAVGPELAAPEGADALDATGMLVMPGFVDTHRHTWQTGIRAIGPDITFGEYLRRVLGELAPRYRPEDVYAANLAGALECLDAGITTLVDWSHIQLTAAHTDAAVEALRRSGIRAVFGYCNTNGADALTTEARRVREGIGDKGGLLTMALAAMGPEVAGKQGTMHEWRIAKELDLPVTVHMREDTGVGFLEESGLLRPRTTYIHGNDFTDDALKRIADSGGAVSISPIIEVELGMGLPPTGRARDAGAPVALSGDTVTSGPGDMFSLMRAAYVLERSRSDWTTRDTLRMATIDGARAAGLDSIIGSLRPGKQADLVLLRTDTPGMAAAHDEIGTVVFSADTGAVDTVLVAGRMVKRHGRLLHHDMPAVLASLRDSGRRLASAAG